MRISRRWCRSGAAGVRHGKVGKDCQGLENVCRERRYPMCRRVRNKGEYYGGKSVGGGYWPFRKPPDLSLGDRRGRSLPGCRTVRGRTWIRLLPCDSERYVNDERASQSCSQDTGMCLSRRRVVHCSKCPPCRKGDTDFLRPTPCSPDSISPRYPRRSAGDQSSSPRAPAGLVHSTKDRIATQRLENEFTMELLGHFETDYLA